MCSLGCPAAGVPHQVIVVVVDLAVATHGPPVGGVELAVDRRRVYVRWRLDEHDVPDLDHLARDRVVLVYGSCRQRQRWSLV